MKPEGGGVAKVCRAFGLQQPLVWAGEEIRLKWNNKKQKQKCYQEPFVREDIIYGTMTTK